MQAVTGCHDDHLRECSKEIYNRQQFNQSQLVENLQVICIIAVIANS